MPTIKAPFNFVPFSTHVFFPEWANNVSHDIPFEDGESGCIKLKIKALSPVYVRNGHSPSLGDEAKRTDPHYLAFSNHAGQCYIPGTAIKGMIRNVFEIMSFSKASHVQDNRYAIREVSPDSFYLKEMQKKQNKIHCGWLKRREDGGYELQDCGIPGRISHPDIDDKLGSTFDAQFDTDSPNKVGLNRDENKAAKFKYDQVKGKSLSGKFTSKGIQDPREIYQYDGEGNPGTLVFTGQPSHRKKPKDGEKGKGKQLEFIFFESASPYLPVNEKIINDFMFAYFEHDSNLWSKDWEWRREMLDKNEPIPVFFTKEGNDIKHMGLSYLYKLPYTYTVRELLPEKHRDPAPDLSDCIFGYVSGKTSLKGRVQFGHAFNTNNAAPDNKKQEILSTPRASYYPIYLRQEVDGNLRIKKDYRTYMEPSSLAGWKRYPVRRDNAVITNQGQGIAADNEKIKTHFKPLKAGAEFECILIFHNLRKVEIGALLSAISFHETHGCHHGIGMAKPLGYGVLNVQIAPLTDLKYKKEEYLASFESMMSAFLGEPWHQRDEIRQLVNMAYAEHTMKSAELQYLTLEEHIDVKIQKEALPLYTSLLQGSPISCKTQLASFRLRGPGQGEPIAIRDKESLVTDIKRQINILKEQKLEELASTLLEKEQAERDAKKDLLAQQEEAERDRSREESRAEGPPLNKEYRDFEDLKKEVEKWLRKVKETVLPNAYHDQLRMRLEEVYNGSRSAKKKQWEEPFPTSPIWRKISGWIGPENAKDWFDGMIGSEE